MNITEEEDKRWSCPCHRGILFPCDVDTGFACVQRCDECGFLLTDDAAAEEFGIELLKRYHGEFIVPYIVLPENKWEDLGAARFVVLKRVNGPSYQPISEEDLRRLLDDLKEG